MTRTPGAAVDSGSEPSVVTRLTRVKERARDWAHALLRPLVKAMARAGVGADFVTGLGLVSSVAAALAYFEGGFRIGAALLVVSGLCDLLDGEIARESGSVTKFGAFLDSTLDRIAEGLVLIGIAGFYLANLVDLTLNPRRVLEELAHGQEPRTWALVAMMAMVAAVGSFLVSYTRARAEGLGLECKVGWFERPERLVVLILAGFIGAGPWMPWALLVLVSMTFTTAGQRIHHVYRITRARPPGAPSQ
jgi:CDP-diacylglycerol--glycerol-3-phosphate 3-phosphatidyltransferase